MRRVAIMVCACFISTSAVAKERQIVDPLTAGLVSDNHVVAVEVIVAATAAEKMAEFEKKAAEKRTATPTTPIAAIPTATDNTVGMPLASVARPQKEQYDTLPFSQMFPLVIEDVTRQWGLVTGRPIKLTITVDTLKTANAGMAMLIGSSDQLAGMVAISDPVTNEKLGSFYIDVLNSHSGLMGLAMRGAGIREKLAEEFSLQTSRVLTGRKSKTPKKTKA